MTAKTKSVTDTEVKPELKFGVADNRMSVEETFQAESDLQEVVNNHFVEGKHFYTTPKTPKKILTKEGAEFLRMWYRIGITIESDIVTVSNCSFIKSSAKCFSLVTDKTFSTGVGIGKPDNITDTALNTAFKMSAKRSAIDGTITAVGGSNLFTQDMDEEIVKSKNKKVKDPQKEDEWEDEEEVKLTFTEWQKTLSAGDKKRITNIKKGIASSETLDDLAAFNKKIRSKSDLYKDNEVLQEQVRKWSDNQRKAIEEDTDMEDDDVI